MKRLLLLLCLLPLSLFSCHQPAAQAKESAVLNEADKLFTSGKYDEALHKYEAALAHASDERLATRALYRAVECETLLYKHEAALDRIHAARLPGDPTLRAIVMLTRLEMLHSLSNWYGFSDETEEGAQGSAKLSRAAADREMEAAEQALWSDRAALAHVTLAHLGDYFVIKDADLTRYPTLWDFTVLKVSAVLRGTQKKVDPLQFTVEDAARDFSAGLPPLVRIAALYEESAHLSGGDVDRKSAGERWRVARVLLGEAAGANKQQREAYTAAAIDRLQTWARSFDTALGRGDAAAQAATALVATKKRTQALQLVDSVLPKTPESDVAVSLRRIRQEILAPEMTMVSRVSRLPAKGALTITTRNVKTVHLRLYHVAPTADAGDNFFSGAYNMPNPDRIIDWLAHKKVAVEWSLQTGDKGDHEAVESTVDVPAPALGLYLCVASGDAAFSIGQATLRAAYLNVTDLAIARVEGEKAVRYYAFDSEKRAPAGDVTFRLLTSTNWRNKNSDEIKAGSDGVASWPLPHVDYMQVDAMAMRGQAIALFANPSWVSLNRAPPPLALFVATDRPIYRPGQKLEVRVTSIERARDGYKIDAARKLRITLTDPNGKELAAQNVTTGAMGSVAATFELPLKGLLGVHSINVIAPGVRDVGNNTSIRVEEYKRPEFEVTLDAPKTATRYGDHTRVSGSVKYYFGGVAPDVGVKFKVSRQRWIPWWMWSRGSSNKTEIARGDVKTGKTGTFDVEFVAAPDPEAAGSDDPDAPDVSDFVIEVEAHDAGGRTISAERRVRVGAQSTLLSADSARGFFMSDESAELRVKATNLEEQAIAAELSWSVEKLAAPATHASEADDAQPLQQRLKNFPAAGGALHTGTLRAGKDEPAKLTLPPLPAGAYRVRLVDKQSGAKGTFHVLVADAKTRALPLAALPALALARRNDLQAGDTAELLVGSGAASGSYHLETWQGEKLLEHHLAGGAAVRVVTVPVTAKHAGGFTARFIGVNGLDVVGADVEIRVPRTDKMLTVKLAPKPDALEPGEKGHFGVEIHDGKGRPVAGEALVTIYDRSLELYAKSSAGWADSLWAENSPPRQRTDGQRDHFATQMPLDQAAQDKIRLQIEGSYKPRRVPGFTWEQSRFEGGYGGGGYRAMSLASNMPGAPPPAPPMKAAAPVAQATTGRRRGGDNDGDGIPDEEQEKSRKQDKLEGENEKAPPPNGPELRTNMAETALFLPDLKVGSDGKGQFSLAAPERLTSWRVHVLALGKLVEAGSGDGTFATKKQLMVRVEIPRFVREGDRATVNAIVHNETDKALTATVKLAIVDDASKHSALETLGVKDAERHVEVPAHGLTPVEFTINAPDNIATYLVRASATAGKLSDAEERPLPLLPSRERLVQSRVVALRGNDHQTIEFPELLHATDASLRSEAMTVSIDPQLALSVLRSIPYLVQYPYECVEQTLNRYVPLAIVAKIYAKHPELAQAIAKAPHRETQYEPWLKDDPRRMLELTETPWLQQSQGGSKDWMLQSLLDPKLVAELQTDALAKLQRAQLGSGGFPWFPGGRENFYMTLYVLEQLAQLQDFGVEVPRDLVHRALRYVQGEMPRYEKKEESDVAFLAYGAYVVTAFDPARFPEAAALRGDVSKWMKYVLDNRTILTPYGRAWCARVEDRLGDKKLALELLDSALDGAQRDPVAGVFWTPERYSWMWYSDSVEKHAFFLRTLAALKPNDERVPGMLQWLLFNRKGNVWHSTKASAAAVYAILDLMEKQGSLTQPERFSLSWDRHEDIVTVKPMEDRREPLMWSKHGREITPAAGKIDVAKQGPGIAFASATWIFSSTKLQEAHASNLVSLERRYFRKVHQGDGDHLVPLKSGDQVHVGEEIEVRLYVKTKSQFEYVHVKEPRGAGFEETTLTSGYRWDKLPAYEEPRDSLFNFFVDWLPHGEFELHHSLRPTTPGRYRIGSAVLQSMYSPDITAYSSGLELEVVK